MNRIPVNCAGANERYDGKAVAVQIEDDGKLIGLLGVFQVLPDPATGCVFVDVECKQRAVPGKEPGTLDGGFVLHLSQSHVDSITFQPDPALEAVLFVSIPFLRRQCGPCNKNRRDEQ